MEDNSANFNDSEISKVLSVFTKDSDENLVGWINFLTDQFYRTIGQAKNFTIAYEIDKLEFIKVFKDFKSDYNKLLEMKQKTIEKKIKHINKCIICGRFTHNVAECPKIHLVRKKVMYILGR